MEQEPKQEIKETNNMNQEFEIQDDSQDKKYFTIIPNFIANHSTANDQALYLQMKRIAGENGRCIASQAYFKRQLGIGHEALKKSFDYLLKSGWITYLGTSESKTRPIRTYKINDIWQKNVDHYSESKKEKISPKTEVSLKDKSPNRTKISPETDIKKNTINNTTKNTIAEASPAEVIPNLLKDKQAHIRIIGLYAGFKGVVFESKEHQGAFIKRNVRPAMDLVSYEFHKISDVMDYLTDNADFKWTISSVGKYIDEDLVTLNLKNLKTIKV